MSEANLACKLIVAAAIFTVMPKVNPAVLAWARETSGLSPEEAVKKLNLKAARGVEALDRLEALETGKDVPTQKMLIQMAKHYRRPLVALYLHDIPPEGPKNHDFRLLYETASQKDIYLVDAIIRDMSSRQSLVRASIEAAGENRELPYVGSMKLEDGVDAIVAAIKNHLGFDIEKFRGTSSPEKSFAYLRSLVERIGIFVVLIDNLKGPTVEVKPETFRGFALVDDTAPFVAININDSTGAWSFTLAHELVHIWIGKTQVYSREWENKIEKLCNEVASNILLYKEEIDEIGIDINTNETEVMNQIRSFARSRKISNTMVAYNLFQRHVITLDTYKSLENTYRNAFLEKNREKKMKNASRSGGPNFYVIQKHRLGALIGFVDRLMKEEALSVTKAGKVFGMHALKVHALIDYSRPKRRDATSRVDQ